MYYSPVRHSSEDAFDLHVLGLPPTIALSQDQTLMLMDSEEQILLCRQLVRSD